MAFKAVDVIDVLDYDFNPFVDAQGITPEPSTAKIRKFQSEIKAALGGAIIDAEKRKLQGGDPTIEELERALSGADETKEAEMLEAIYDAVAAVCSNKPTKTQIKALPWRIQQHFIGYISGKFLSGEASTPAMIR